MLLNDKVIGDVISYNNSMTGGVILKKNKGWRNDYTKGGGCLFDYGPHCFDLSTYFFGTDVHIESSVLKKVFSTEVDDEGILPFIGDPNPDFVINLRNCFGII